MADVSSVSAVTGSIGASMNTNYISLNRLTPVSDTQKQTDKSDERKKTSDQDESKRQEWLEDVISRSKDGDTLQASKSAVNKLEEDERDGRVVKKDSLLAAREVDPAEQKKKQAEDPDAAQKKESAARAAEEKVKKKIREELEKQEAASKAKEKSEDSKAQNASSFAGYTEAQLKQMYLKGDISKNSYDKEIDRREDLKEDQDSQSKAVIALEQKSLSQAYSTAQTALELKELGNEDSAQIPEALTRAQILNALEANTLFQNN